MIAVIFLGKVIIVAGGKKPAPVNRTAKRLIKLRYIVSCHARRWYVHNSSAFPLSQQYWAVLT
jgi:hypothetical protein